MTVIDEMWQKVMQDIFTEDIHQVVFPSQPDFDFDFDFGPDLPAAEPNPHQWQEPSMPMLDSSSLSDVSYNIDPPPSLPRLPSLAMTSFAEPMRPIEASDDTCAISMEDLSSAFKRIEER